MSFEEHAQDGRGVKRSAERASDVISQVAARSRALCASVEEIMPGLFSVLVEGRSYQVNVAPHADGFEVWVGLERYFISLADPRDRASNSRQGGAAGPVELRAQMPGKIVKLLAAVGAKVTAGQGLIVVEAMKMQNEVKAPKEGTVAKIHVAEGATVAAGDLLVVVE